MLEQLDEQRDVGADAEDRVAAKGCEGAEARGLARFTARDQFREQGIVVDGDLGPFRHA